jgi:GTP-binding protein HflX
LLLVGVGVGTDAHDVEASLEELALLARTAGGIVTESVTQRRPGIDPHSYMGSGKAEEVRARCEELEVDVVVLDNELSPAQGHNLEKLLGRRVLDRTQLILDIFASRAKTRGAKTQVELAQLEYLLPRLKRMWTHLERFEGGIGMRGPGEKQLETDRRLVRLKIQKLKRELQAVSRQRTMEVRQRHDCHTVALVGYTNAGKSTLLNRLTGAQELVEDRLFSTLDTRTRTWTLGSGRKVLLSDTVGFVRRLPHQIVSSFHATLEEARMADLLLHVVDAGHPEAPQQIAVVEDVLKEIGAQEVPTVLVFNKVDALENKADLAALQNEHHRHQVAVSARTGAGLDRLADLVATELGLDLSEYLLDVPAGDGRLLAQLASAGKVLERSYVGERVRLRMMLETAMARKVESFVVNGDGKR